MSAGFDYRTSMDWRYRNSWRAQTKSCAYMTQEKGAVTPHETEPELPVYAWEFLAEILFNSSLEWGQGHWLQQSWESQHAGKSLWRSLPLPLSLTYSGLSPNYMEGTQLLLSAENQIKDLLSLMNYGQRFLTLYRRQGSRPSPWKRIAKSQNGCLWRPYK